MIKALQNTGLKNVGTIIVFSSSFQFSSLIYRATYRSLSSIYEPYAVVQCCTFVRNGICISFQVYRIKNHVVPLGYSVTHYNVLFQHVSSGEKHTVQPV